MKKTLKISILFILALITISQVTAQNTINKIDLSGEWKFAIGREDKGISGQWFNKPLSGSVTLPGSMATNGKGDEIIVNTKYTGQIIDQS